MLRGGGGQAPAGRDLQEARLGLGLGIWVRGSIGARSPVMAFLWVKYGHPVTIWVCGAGF